MEITFKKKSHLNEKRQRAWMIVILLAVFNTLSWAQSIDFDNAKLKTATNFTSWYVDGQGTTKTINGVTFTLGTGSGSAATQLKGNWWKDGVNYDMQVGDGLTAYNSSGGKPTSGSVSITVKIRGLSAGTHSLQAYHNYVEADGNYTVPPINVSVNGVVQVTGLQQSMRATSTSTSAKSYVTFNVGSTSQETTITYYTVPANGTSYFCTGLFINSLELGVDNADNLAQNPYPASMDCHVNADGGSLTLSWTQSVNTPTRHIYYFGTDSTAVLNATSGGTSTTSTSFTKSGLNPMQKYYWRVDEVINGNTYTGKVWSFRPRRLAFPGADGAGKYATGGRGGVVYHVTSLADDANTNGTLRYGLERLSGPRTIVFDVSGVITLQSTLTCSDPYVTIAGQTAPGIGIMLRNQPFGSNSNDGITRFMRFRYGHGDDWNGTSPNENTGNAGGLSANYGIMDHCLLGWGSDETFSSRGAKNYSFQHNIIGESLNQNGHKNYYNSNNAVQHGFAATVAGDVGSLHHNLLAHNEGRAWSLGGGLDGAGAYAGRLNIRDNVVYNWGGRATDGGVHEGNFVNNYYKKGPATTQNFIFIAQLEGAGSGTQEYYLNGNYRVSQDGNTKTPDTNNNTYKYELSGGQNLNWNVWASSPYSFWNHESQVETSADAAFKNVLSDVGCNYAGLDNNEARLVSESFHGTFTKYGSRSGKPGLIDKESDSEGWNGLGITSASRPSGWDSDNDGIPNWFENAKGWNASSANNNVYNTSTYYTNLEDYLNWMAEPHFIGDTDGEGITVAVNKTVALAGYFAGYTSPSYSIVSNSGTAQASISNGELIVNAPASMANKVFTIAVRASESGVSLTRNFNFYVGDAPVVNPDPTPDPTTSMVTEEGTIYWEFNQGGANQTATLSSNFEGFVTASTTLGSNLTWAGTKVLTGITESLIGVKVNNEASANNNNRLMFNITPASECSFAVTHVEFYISRIGTDGGNYNVAWGNQTLTTGQKPARNNANPPYTVFSYNLNGASSSAVQSLIINLYKLGITKQFGIARIMIRGNLTHPSAMVQDTGTIQWKFDGGGANQTATIPSAFQSYVSTSVSKGNTLKYAGTRVCSNITETLMGTNINNESNANSGNALTFSITPTNGSTFKATSVSFTATRIGTDGSALNVSFDGTTLASGIRPARNNANPAYTTYTYNVNGADNESVKQFIINIYQLGSTKQVGIANVSVTGVLTHPANARANQFTMDEEEETTAIETPEVSTERKIEGWYTLQGVKIEQPSHPGIYIFNGKKVVVR